MEAEQSTQGPKINDPIIRTGYAEIKVLNTFTKRWFILHEGVLCYYRTEKVRLHSCRSSDDVQQDDPREYFGVIHLLDTKVYLINKDQIQITHVHHKGPMDPDDKVTRECVRDISPKFRRLLPWATCTVME